MSSSVCATTSPQLEICDWNRNENKNNNSIVNTRKKKLKKTTFVYNCWRELLKSYTLKIKHKKPVEKLCFICFHPTFQAPTHAYIMLIVHRPFSARECVEENNRLCRWQHCVRLLTQLRTWLMQSHIPQLISQRTTIKESNKRNNEQSNTIYVSIITIWEKQNKTNTEANIFNE